MRPYRDGDWIAVRRIRRNAEAIYCGKSLSHAADALEPGTCYGTGADRQEAIVVANGERARLRGLAKAAKAAF